MYLSFVGGQLYNCPYPAPTSADSVDVSTVTVASFWAAGPPDYTACQHEPTQRGKSGLLSGPLAVSMGCHRVQFSDTYTFVFYFPKLQDTLIQREGELARLHEENNKLKEFLNSSFVKTLEEKTKRLLSAQSGDRRKNRKRNSEIQNLHSLLLGSQVKRTCRNLSLQFCSEEELASTPPVDLWILQTLGLKDEDTIDTTSTEYSFNSPIDSLTKCTSSPNLSQDSSPGLHHTPSPHCRSPSSLVGGDVTTQYPELSTPRSRTELAFSMSLNPSSSVRLKTHSFPQGQAFVRKDTLGGWNFTWVPKQGP
uniref:Geminin coiled-coil domain containing n=1 Tax=Salmo trutta TaxID=8032 RepID=A0A673ZIV8_SALTR